MSRAGWLSAEWLKAEEQIAEHQAQLQAAVAEALYDQATVLARLSQEYVPIGETGALRDSCLVHDVEQQGETLSVDVTYGETLPAPEVAVVQHERLDFHHTQGQAKWLQRAADEIAPGLTERIGRAVDQKLRGT
jgi:hypothetical protein